MIDLNNVGEELIRLAIQKPIIKGQADLTNWELLSLKEISVYDYMHAYELPTDQYSLSEDETI